MTRIESWIAAKIEECSPSGARGSGGLEDLLRALLFLEGRASQVFGMSADRATMPDADTLRAACTSAIRGWFEELGRSDPPAQLQLFEVATRHGLSLDVPEPECVGRIRGLEIERTRALAELGRPSGVLSSWPSVASDLAELRAAGEHVSFRAIAKSVRLPKPLGMAQFEWLCDEWTAVAEASLEPAFLPIAGADGDYLGLVLDVALLDQGLAPLVYYFHEHDPVYAWVFESCATAVNVLRAVGAEQSPTEASRGIEHERVTELLQEMNDFDEAGDVSTRAVSRRWISEGPLADDIVTVFEGAGHAFAVRNILAQRTWRELEAKIHAARPVRA